MTHLQVLNDISSVLAVKETLDNLGGDPELLRELLDFFLEIIPPQLDDLELAVMASDLATVDLQAHSMKGGAANVGALRLAALAKELEERAKAGSLEGAEDLVKALRQAFADLQVAAPHIDWDALS